MHVSSALTRQNSVKIFPLKWYSLLFRMSSSSHSNNIARRSTTGTWKNASLKKSLGVPLVYKDQFGVYFTGKHEHATNKRNLILDISWWTGLIALLPGPVCMLGHAEMTLQHGLSRIEVSRSHLHPSLLIEYLIKDLWMFKFNAWTKMVSLGNQIELLGPESGIVLLVFSRLYSLYLS